MPATSPPSDDILEQTLDRFWETVPPLWSNIRSHIRTTAAERFDISVEQFHILRHVRRGKGSVSELATAKHISRPAISQGVDVLVKKGLLTRIQNTQDRRFVQLALTPSGNKLLDSIFKETRGWMKERMCTISASELNNVICAMESLKKMME